jgi:hypothetical protein
MKLSGQRGSFVMTSSMSGQSSNRVIGKWMRYERLDHLLSMEFFYEVIELECHVTRANDGC